VDARYDANSALKSSYSAAAIETSVAGFTTPKCFTIISYMAESESRLIIVGCGRAKIWKKRRKPVKVAAKDAYTSGLFRLARRFAETHSTRWLILSAKYGLLRPEALISNYDVTIGSPNAIRSRIIAQQWRRFAPRSACVVSLTSKKYVELLSAALPETTRVETPMHGLNLFQRTRWLKRNS
jgi:hypothetical protein